MWRISEKDKNKIRSIVPIIRSKDFSLIEKTKVLHNNIRPLLGWAIELFESHNINKDEAESELYIILYTLVERYDDLKGNFISFIGTQLPWELKKIIDSINKNNYLNIDNDNIEDNEESYELPDEIYLCSKIPIQENRWIFKDLQKKYKYLIVKILASDEDVKFAKLASDIGIGRTKFFNLLLELREEMRKKGLKC